MRHVPTALYLDTQVFKKQGLKFETKVFIRLQETFIQGGIRLLIPKFMERELKRHFRDRASEAANQLMAKYTAHPINLLSLPGLPSKEEIESESYHSMVQQWESFKKHFVVEELPLVGELEDVVDWYFNVEPPFGEGKKAKEFPDAFILSALDQYHRKHSANIAAVSEDGDFKSACARRRFVAHYHDLDKYIDEFEPQLKSSDLERPENAPTRPRTTDDLTELRSILLRGSKVTPIEIDRVMELLEGLGPCYDHFFRHASDGIWIQHLREKGHFDDPPDIETTVDGRTVALFWAPMNYLVRAYDNDPDSVIQQVERLPDISNPHILRAIIDIILKANSVGVASRLSSRILSALDHARIGSGRILSLLKIPRLFEEPLSSLASIFLSKVVDFLPDPDSHEKKIRFLENPLDWTTSLEPSPRFDTWEYHEILDKGVRPLANKAPYVFARILIDAMASVIRMSSHQENQPEDSSDESLEFQLNQLHSPGLGLADPKLGLMQTLIFACKAVYENSPESVELLDQALRNQQPRLFRRIRQLLYSLYPNQQTLPWIRESILEDDGYASMGLDYEFQRMIRKACEHFGPDLISEDELRQIVEKILGGPPFEKYLRVSSWTRESATVKGYQEWKRFYHRKDLRPFESLLTGDCLSYYQELENEFADAPLSDEDYLDYKTSSGGFVSYESPLMPEELGMKQDDELLTFINEWEEKREDSEDWLKRISIRGLADEFQQIFKDVISPNEERVRFWLDNRSHIERPVYVKAIIQAFQELVQENHFEHLDRWLEFCAWVLALQDWRNDDGLQRHENSRDFPDWESSRRAVGDLVGVCLKETVEVPIAVRKSLEVLLTLLCTQLDWRLDGHRPPLLKRTDHITEGINSTRGRALQDLVNYGFWVQREFPDDTVPEVSTILENRFADNTGNSLTLPERAILGLNYSNLLILDPEWTAKHKEDFFPQNDLSAWSATFGSFLRFSVASTPIFENLKEEYNFALLHFAEFEAMIDSDGEVLDGLGKHLFDYYIWEFYSLNGEDSLLEDFYLKTSSDRQRWANLFDHVGRSLRRSKKPLEENLRDRVVAFFDWRFQSKELGELRQFGFWLDAECLDPDWRLDALMKLLDMNQWKEKGLSIMLTSLEKMLEGNTARVVKCFARMTETLSHGSFFPQSAVRAIILAGLNSEDGGVYGDAERAQENLLDGREFDLSDLE